MDTGPPWIDESIERLYALSRRIFIQRTTLRPLRHRCGLALPALAPPLRTPARPLPLGGESDRGAG